MNYNKTGFQTFTNFVSITNFLNKLLLCLIICVTFASVPLVSAAPVNIDKAAQIASNFMVYLHKTYEIKETKPVELSGKSVGYLINLKPHGYILVAGDTIRVPVKAYSFKSDFENLPQSYIDVLLKQLAVEPQGTIAGLSAGTKSSSREKVNQSYWDFLNNFNATKFGTMASYTPDTYLLTTHWGQDFPYNKFNPKLNGESTITGCTQTAIAQIMRYYKYPNSGSGAFTTTWNGQTLTAVLNHPYNWNIMPDVVTGNTPEYQQDEVARLMYDLGVFDQADFGIFETGGTAAALNYIDFAKAFHYAPVKYMDSSNSNFFITIKNEIDNKRPVLLNLPGHATVADGYASDGSGKKVHINLGWDGSYDDYYYLDQTNYIDNDPFGTDNCIYYNIHPCQDNECVSPYNTNAYGGYPVIKSDLNDIVITEPVIINLQAYDSDGSTVNLSAKSLYSGLQASLNGNLLTLTPLTDNNTFSEVTITAQSNDGEISKTFKVLSLTDKIYAEAQYNIGGKFLNETQIDRYSAYLQGNISISGCSGYSNQGFYIWVEDENGNIVIPASNEAVSGNLTAGLYNICTSLTNSITHYHYSYDANFSEYNLSVKCTDSDQNKIISDLADYMGVGVSASIPIAVNPTSIDLTAGDSGNVVVSGGVAPYTVVSSDNNFAAAILTDNTVSITGVAAGTATITITDSAVPANTIEVAVTITAASIPVPVGQNLVRITNDAIAAAPVYMGSVATGTGNQMQLSLVFPKYDAAVDIYVGIMVPNGTLFLLDSDGNFVTNPAPYAIGVTDAIKTTVVDAFNVCNSFGTSTIPIGTWTAYFLVIPTNGGNINAINWVTGNYEIKFYTFDVECN